ncbi:MAG: hypothetical protein RL235_875 [Chlamydiota bacterium]|jgi:hypothetical protein
MNFTGFVFALLLILSFGVLSLREQCVQTSRLRSSFTGHGRSCRSVLAKQQSKQFAQIAAAPTPTAPDQGKPAPYRRIIPKVNPESARINLLPLIVEAEDTTLFEIVAGCIHRLYANDLFLNEPGYEKRLLGALVLALKKNPDRCLEAVRLSDPKMQKVYYRMLKGTVDFDWEQGLGYPSLLEVVKVSGASESLYLQGAHPMMLALLFGPKVALPLFDALHQKGGRHAITEEFVIQTIFTKTPAFCLPSVFGLIAWNKPKPTEFGAEICVAEDDESHIVLRKTLHLRR